MLSIALCDDDGFELEKLKNIVADYCSIRNIPVVVDSYLSGQELLNCLKKYNIIFLDIQMQGINGIDLAKKIREHDKYVKIIYVTNYASYQADAFSVRAFGYIVKPFSGPEIDNELNDAIEYLKQSSNETVTTFDTEQGIKTIKLKDIIYFDSYYHKVHIHCIQNSFIIDNSIINILNRFQSYGFSMPHKSFIINLAYISKINGYNVYLTNGDIVPISQKRAVEFKSEFHSFLRNNFNLLMKR